MSEDKRSSKDELDSKILKYSGCTCRECLQKASQSRTRAISVISEIQDDIPNPRSAIEDKAEGYEVIGGDVHIPGIKSKDLIRIAGTSKQNNRAGRQRLQRKKKYWPGSEVVGGGVHGSVRMETEIKLNDKTRRRRQRLQRKENTWKGSDVFGYGVHGSVLMDAEIKLKDTQDDDVPNPRSKNEDKAKETIHDKKIQSRGEKEAEETVDDKKTSSYSQTLRLRRQRLQRKGKVWPGYEVIGDGVSGSNLMDTVIKPKDGSSYNQKARQRRQRLQRKEKIWPGA